MNWTFRPPLSRLSKPMTRRISPFTTVIFRLIAPDQCDELGLDDAFAHDVCLIEWPEILGPLTPPGALHITLTVTGDAQRTMAFETTNPRWHTVIGGLNVA